ncbi:hypothetical protein DPMN_115627 [Dreissena polymorpha]|uniref:Uncharacterized protein n=1 Tax=Dreissena polymorpha TaxID=45954 RepID=A0A9D4KLL6_DREPO|nr:hypothetical protein DPMN_115627 [Dreissena polymorpha]
MRKDVRVDTPLSANNFALKEYVNSFPQGKEAVEHHKAKKEKMPTPTASTPTTKAELFSMMPADLALVLMLIQQEVMMYLSGVCDTFSVKLYILGFCSTKSIDSWCWLLSAILINFTCSLCFYF